MSAADRMKEPQEIPVTWPDYARFIRSREKTVHVWLEKLRKMKNDGIEASDKEYYMSILAYLALFDGPIVEYRIPKDLWDIFSESTFDPEIIISDFFFLPHQIMAFAESEQPAAFSVWGIDDEGLVIASSSFFFRIPFGMTVGEALKMSLGPRSVYCLLSILLYFTQNDHSERTVSEPRGGKRERNNPRPTIIRGEVGGKFMSALRRYEARQDVEYASRPHGSPRPHIRGAHIAKYWTGKGSRKGTGPKILRLRFIHPCLVNADSVGPDVEIQRTVRS